MGITEVVVIIKKGGLSSCPEIENTLKMAHRHDISAYVLNEIPIREDYN